jgi:hypothetical protein
MNGFVEGDVDSRWMSMDDETGAERFYVILSREPFRLPEDALASAPAFRNWLDAAEARGEIRTSHTEPEGKRLGIHGSFAKAPLLAEIRIAHHRRLEAAMLPGSSGG